jgi:SOS response associated peptidase (SRAP)
MCGRYSSTKPDSDIAKEFKVEAVVGEEPEASWNVAPTQIRRVVLEHAPRDADVKNAAPRVLRSARWGLVPPWAKDVKIGSRLINARSETVDHLLGWPPRAAAVDEVAFEVTDPLTGLGRQADVRRSHHPRRAGPHPRHPRRLEARSRDAELGGADRAEPVLQERLEARAPRRWPADLLPHPRRHPGRVRRPTARPPAHVRHDGAG